MSGFRNSVVPGSRPDCHRDHHEDDCHQDHYDEDEVARESVLPGSKATGEEMKDTIGEKGGEVQVVHLQYFPRLLPSQNDFPTRSYGRTASSMVSWSVSREGTR